MTEMFQTTKQNVSLHIQDVFDERELTPEATVKKYLTVSNVLALKSAASAATACTAFSRMDGFVSGKLGTDAGVLSSVSARRGSIAGTATSGGQIAVGTQRCLLEK
jgi:hypothetical protein